MPLITGPRLWVIAPLLLILCSFAGGAWAEQEQETVRIGVLAKRGAEQALAMWGPTADYLSRQVNGYRFEIVPLDFPEVYPATEAGAVDFILANSGIYVELEVQYGVGRIATLRNLGPGSHTYTHFGGVIFTRSDRSDINGLADLSRQRFAAVEFNSFGGWWVAWRELHTAGIDPFRDFAEMRFTGTHDAVVHAVLDGSIDAGTVRTDTLERMAAEEKIDLSQIKVIAPHTHRGFGYAVSTRLYPEWPFAKLAHTSDALGDRVAAALLAMPEESEAARAGQVTGWTVPSNYQPVHDLMRELKIGPYQGLGKVSFGDLVRHYWPWMGVIAGFLVVLGASNAYVSALNRRLRRSDEALREARDNLAEKVRERTAELESALANLGESNRRLDLALQDWNDAFDAIQDPIFIHDAAMHIVHANPAYAQRAGLSLDELLGRPYWQVFPPLDEPLQACRTFPEAVHDEGEEITLPSGEVFVSRSFGIKAADGTLHNAIHILEDVTAERRAEARRRTLSRAVEEAREGMVILDRERRIAYCNPAFGRLLGSSEGGTDQRPFEELFIDETRGLEEMWAHVETQGNWSGELLLSDKEGNAVPVYLSVSDIHDGDGNAEGYVASALDLSALKRAEGELQYRVRFESELGGIAARFLAINGGGLDRELSGGLARLGQFLGIDRVLLMRCGPDQNVATQSHAWSRADDGNGCVAWDLQELEWLRRQLNSGEVVHIPDVAGLPDEARAERAFFGSCGTRGTLLVPMFFHGTVIGFLAFEAVTDAHPFRTEDIRLLRTAAEIVANGLMRHEAEAAVRRSEASLAQAQKIAHLGNWDWNIVTNGLYWSDEIYRIFGVEPQQFGATYDAFLNYVHPDDRQQVIETVNRAVAAHEAYAIDHRIVLADGTVRVVHEMGEVTYGTDGTPLRMIGTVQDVTEARQAETELRRLNRALRTLSRGNTTLVHATDEQQLLEDICRTLIDTGGYRFAWVGRPLDDEGRTVAPLASAGHEEGYLDQVTVGWGEDRFGQGPTGTAVRRRELVIVRDTATDASFSPWREAAGARGYASVIALPLLTEEELIGVLTIDAAEPDAFDDREVALLTELAGDLAFGIRMLRLRAERERAVAAMHDSEKRYHDLYDTAPAGYASVDTRTGNLLQCNPAFAEMLGYARDELIGRPIFDLYADTAESQMAARQVFHGFLADESIRDRELQMVCSDGAVIWVSLSVEPVFDAAGTLVESRSSIINISARKEAEAERRGFAEQLERSLLQTIEAIALTIEKRDPYTAGHQQRVAELAVAIAEEMELPHDRIEGLRLGAQIHDIGKVYIPTEILNRPGKLDDAQFLLIKAHPQVGFDIVRGIDFPWPLAAMVAQHHERLDGSGYPAGLKDGEILLEARIIAVADVVEAMASHRPYRPALPLEVAMEEIEKHQGVWFDTEVVDACLRLFREKNFHWRGKGAGPGPSSRTRTDSRQAS